MTAQNTGLRRVIVTAGACLLVGIGAAVRMPLSPPPPDTHARTESPHYQRLDRLEQAVTALALQVKQTTDWQPEPTRVATPAPASPELSRQDLARIIRDEVRNAVAKESPEAQRAKEEALAEAKILNSLENREAYQSASSVVQTAVAAQRWTEDDKETFRAAFGQLTNNQRVELMNLLAPAINNGEVKVEVMGPLF